MRIFKHSLAWGILLIIGFAIFVVVSYQSFKNRELSVINTALFTIEQGESFNHIISKLIQEEYTNNQLYWKILGIETRTNRLLKAGEYVLKQHMLPEEVLQLFASGKVKQYQFTIIEGWTFDDLKKQLSKNPSIKHTINDSSDVDILHHLDLKIGYLEGQFLPDTYYFPRGFKDIDLLKRAHVALNKLLEEVWESRVSGLAINDKDELLTLASIVEKETGMADERPIIAGVFLLRLQKKMRLQTDPTVIYGLGESFDGNLTRTNLKNDTPYNTYTRFGLPPTPIAMASRESLLAVANPEIMDYLYFVAKGDGTHIFSKNLQDHQQAVNHYQKKRRSP